MLDNELKDICKKLRPCIGRRADALWFAYLTAPTADSRRDAEGFIHMFAAKHLASRVDDRTIFLPPPTKDVATGDFNLGTVMYSNKPLFPLGLRRENFTKHIGIFSITGGGKTNVAQILLLNLLRDGTPFLVIDWKRSYRALKTLSDNNVSAIQVYPVGRKGSNFNWNPLRPPPRVDPKTWISIIADALERSHISGQGVANIFIKLLDKKFEEAGVYSEKFERYPNFFDADEELQRTRFGGRKGLWQDSCERILKTFTFGPAAGAFNARNPLKLEELLEKPVVIELDQELPKPLRIFFSEVILRWIHLYRLGQGESDTLRHVTILEEIHTLFAKTTKDNETNNLENVFREIRSFGEGLVTITQHPSLVPIYVLGNCNTQIYLGLQHADDIMTAKRALFLEENDKVFLDRLAVGEGIVKIKGRIEPCHVRFPLVPIKRSPVNRPRGNSEDNRHQ